MMWLVYREQQDGCRIMHGRNVREFRLPKLPRLSVDCFCRETNAVYKLCGCYWHGHICLPYRYVRTGAGDTIAQRYERNMARLEQIRQAGYQVEGQWKCDFDKGILAHHPELKLHPVVQHSPLNTQDALYGGRSEAMRLNHKAGDGDTIQYLDVKSLYPYVWNYFKFPIDNSVIHVGNACEGMQVMLLKDGLRKSSILPLRRLFHPALPFRCKKRLLFCLC